MNPYFLMALTTITGIATTMLMKSKKTKRTTRYENPLFQDLVPKHLQALFDELNYRNGYKEPEFHISPEDDMKFSYIISDF